ncbi:outer membrane beta-barrel protein [Candidatus Kryptobacter tengchongensis]|uniref:outer membrane beta-barrel protein n=1 Tax=Kryptobacter tengchongensis TaxID=1643429 RepID=UPI000708077C|nr:outer membrane beta-barrel protein [Candidatus Kryptobacter tengchongensis]CUS87338.1 Outer membrane protein beta-barrel domain-containing protein [Candidatus Kryptobacter tengchongensis]
MKKAKVVLLLTFLFLVSCFSQNFTLSFYLGKNIPQNTYLKISQDINKTFLRFENIELTDKAFEFPLYYGLKLSYDLKFINPKVFAEAEFIHSKVYSNPSQFVQVFGIYRDSPIDTLMRFGAIVQNFSISHGLNYVILNFGYKINFNPVTLAFLKFGVGPSIVHFETTVDSLPFERYEVNGFVVQFSSGFSLKFYNKVSGFIELKYTSGEILNAGIFGGTAETFIKMWHVVFGLGYSI